MNSIYFQDEHQQFRDSVRHFFEAEVDGELWEKKRCFPPEIWTKMAALGFLGINFANEYGGSEAGFFYSAVFLEELGRLGIGGFGAAVGVQQYMATAHIQRFGSELLKARYLTASVSGTAVGALAISEPDVGSDVANLRTTAIREADSYLVNGSKTFITNGCDGHFATVAVRTGKEGSGGISLLVIDQGTPGFSSKRLNKMGWHCGDTAELNFDNVRVPIQNLVGEEGQGFYYLMECFQLERLVAALTSIGGIDLTLKLAHDYLQTRQAFGRSLSRYQTLRHTFANLATDLAAARQLTYHACWLFEQDLPAVEACTMSKLKTSELAKRAADECLQFFGGYGFMDEYPISRLYRDARVGTIVGGTSEIMREILAKILIDGTQYQSTAKMPAPSLSISDIFRQLPARYRGGLDDAIVNFDFSSDNNGQYSVAVNQLCATVEEHLHDHPDCVVTCSGSLYKDLELGNTTQEAAFMSGSIHISNISQMTIFMRGFKKLEPT